MKQCRNSSLDLLRIVSMMMVIGLHFLIMVDYWVNPPFPDPPIGIWSI